MATEVEATGASAQDINLLQSINVNVTQQEIYDPAGDSPCLANNGVPIDGGLVNVGVSKTNQTLNVGMIPVSNGNILKFDKIGGELYAQLLTANNSSDYIDTGSFVGTNDYYVYQGYARIPNMADIAMCPDGNALSISMNPNKNELKLWKITYTPNADNQGNPTVQYSMIANTTSNAYTNWVIVRGSIFSVSNANSIRILGWRVDISQNLSFQVYDGGFNAISGATGSISFSGGASTLPPASSIVAYGVTDPTSTYMLNKNMVIYYASKRIMIKYSAGYAVTNASNRIHVCPIESFNYTSAPMIYEIPGTTGGAIYAYKYDIGAGSEFTANGSITAGTTTNYKLIPGGAVVGVKLTAGNYYTYYNLTRNGWNYGLTGSSQNGTVQTPPPDPIAIFSYSDPSSNTVVSNPRYAVKATGYNTTMTTSNAVPGLVCLKNNNINPGSVIWEYGDIDNWWMPSTPLPATGIGQSPGCANIFLWKTASVNTASVVVGDFIMCDSQPLGNSFSSHLKWFEPYPGIIKLYAGTSSSLFDCTDIAGEPLIPVLKIMPDYSSYNMCLAVNSVSATPTAQTSFYGGNIYSEAFLGTVSNLPPIASLSTIVESVDGLGCYVNSNGTAQLLISNGYNNTISFNQTYGPISNVTQLPVNIPAAFGLPSVSSNTTFPLPIPASFQFMNNQGCILTDKKFAIRQPDTVYYQIQNFDYFGFKALFSLFGQYYGFDGQNIYNIPYSNSVLSGRPQIQAIAYGLIFLCNSQSNAYFYNSSDNAIYTFNGGRTVDFMVRITQAPQFPIVGMFSAYSLPTNELVIMDPNTKLPFFIKDGIIRQYTSTVSTTDLVSTSLGPVFVFNSTNEGGPPYMNLLAYNSKLPQTTILDGSFAYQSAYFGFPDNQTTRLDKFVFRVSFNEFQTYSPGNTANLPTFNITYKWFTQDSSGTETAAIQPITGYTPSPSGYATFTWMPKQHFVMGASIGISTTSQSTYVANARFCLLNATVYYKKDADANISNWAT